ncbi:shufflon system plasmid conjugative transfer pilus tip adhesin PilV [Asaia spathodeae]|uniref:Shufflon system plasmid conjugative transfer pilus tip adhesin PilV n=2 Tax=Asaia spathodeae TaxID=657016 RepID=A0ABX2P8N9_9PROT|nr:shufflon system plasmid conjugative transfer pilus tip adhesin PilV [Asaia spathodeae]
MSVAAATLSIRYARSVSDNLDQRAMALTAQTFQDLLQGANKYAQENSSDLESAIGVGSYREYDLQTLINASALPVGFSALNTFRQQWHVVFQQPQTGVIRCLVYSTGGTAYSAASEVNIAAMAGHYGGFVPYDGIRGNLNSGSAQGAGGAWNLWLGGLPNPGPGHLYGLVTINGGSLVSNDYLYRHAVPNHPEYNTMATPLNMGRNDINNAGSGRFAGAIGTMGVDPNTKPPGWGGGLSTFDVTALGTIAAGPANQNPVAGLNSSGDGWFNRNAYVGNQLSAASVQVNAGNNVNIGPTGSVYADGSNIALRTPGTAYMQHQDGSPANIAAQDAYVNYVWANRVSLPAGENLYIGDAAILGDAWNIALRPANGRIYIQNRYGLAAGDMDLGQLETHKGVLFDRTDANPGYGCGPNGLVAGKFDGSGVPLACINGVWSALTASFNTGSWVSGWLGFNQMSGPFTNNAGTAAAVNVVCPSRSNDLRIQIIMDNVVLWDSGAYVGGGYNSTQSGSVIIPAGKWYYVTLSGFPGQNGQCYIAARW